MLRPLVVIRFYGGQGQNIFSAGQDSREDVL
jgi:hypothetical protein